MTEKLGITPIMSIRHDKEKYTITVELPGVDKRDIDLEMTETSFCMHVEREDVRFSVCAALAHPVDHTRADARFKQGLLRVVVPLKETYKGTRVKIK